MTTIKICGLSRVEDIQVANDLDIAYIGFVFYEKSFRNLTREKASELKKHLRSGIQAVGVFVDYPIEEVASLLNDGIIDIAQLHGKEDEAYIAKLRSLTDGKTVWKAFKVTTKEDLKAAEDSSADMILLDAGMGGGTSFDWSLLNGFTRDYLLAGGLNLENIKDAIELLHPYGIDISSGVETDRLKDASKMKCLVEMVKETE